MNTVLGLEVFLASGTEKVAGKRLGLLACPSSVDRHLVSSVERLHRHPDLELRALFAPEHGIRGDAQAGAKVATSVDPRTGLPVYSLYGETRAPAPETLAELDAIVIDIQDGGVRFYTYLATALHVMRGAAAARIEVIILDRPAPITASRVEGPLLEPGYESFVGPAPLPIRYGMTIGEIALTLNQSEAIGCDLSVVPLANWTRELWHDQTGLPFVPSSPNLPTLDSMTLYPGTCLFEGANLSEGRGTTRPFEYIGAPWIEAEALADVLNEQEMPGLRFRPVYFAPVFGKYQGELCAGVHIYTTDREVMEPVASTLRVLRLIQSLYPERFAWRQPWREGGALPIDLLWGGDSLRRWMDSGASLADFRASWQPGLERFRELRERYLLY